MQYKAVIFDFFDVIHNDPFQRWLKSHGIPREGAWHQASVDLDKGLITAPEFLERLSELIKLPPSVIDKQLAAFDGFNQEVIDFIKMLAKTHQVGLLSNGPSAFVRKLLRQGTIEDTFHHIVISSEVGMVKPEPEIFHHILRKMSVKPHEAIFIDDNPKNVDAAKAVGMSGICFSDLPSLRDALNELGVKLAPA